MSGPESNWQDWVRKAENDLLNIRNNLATKEVPWDTVCFHAQQVAEKMLKGFLLFHGIDPKRTHDLVRLLRECVEQDAALNELRASCLLLNPYSVDARCPEPSPAPDELYAPREPEGRTAAEAAKRVFTTILGHLPARRREGEGGE